MQQTQPIIKLQMMQRLGVLCERLTCSCCFPCYSLTVVQWNSAMELQPLMSAKPSTRPPSCQGCNPLAQQCGVLLRSKGVDCFLCLCAHVCCVVFVNRLLTQIKEQDEHLHSFLFSKMRKCCNTSIVCLSAHHRMVHEAQQESARSGTSVALDLDLSLGGAEASLQVSRVEMNMHRRCLLSGDLNKDKVLNVCLRLSTDPLDTRP